MKKILVVSHNFYPKINPRSFRTYELLKVYLKNRNEIDFITEEKIDKNVYFKDFENINIYFLKEEYTHKKMLYHSSNSFIKGVKKYLRYLLGEPEIFNLLRLLKVLNKVKNEEYDVIISIGLPFYTHIALYLSGLLNKKGIKICDCGDPFYENKFYKIAFYFKYIQKIIFKKFDYLFVPIEEAKKEYTLYKDESKIKVIPQGVDFSSIKIANYEQNRIPTFAYAGNFHKVQRDPENFLKILKSINLDFKFILYTSMIEGNYFTELLLKYKNEIPEKIEIRSLISREKCIFELSKMDFLIDIKNENESQLPSKLIDYGCTKRPVYSFKGSSNVIKENLIQFLEGNYENSLKIDLTKYDIDKIYMEIEKLEDIK